MIACFIVKPQLAISRADSNSGSMTCPQSGELGQGKVVWSSAAGQRGTLFSKPVMSTVHVTVNYALLFCPTTRCLYSDHACMCLCVVCYNE